VKTVAKAKPAPKPDPPVVKRGVILKADEDRGLVYGYASMSTREDGSLYEDLQGDVIEPDVLENAALEFMLHHRAVDEMHAGDPIGAIVESLVVTPEKLVKMGIPAEVAETIPVGWWVGAKVTPDVFAKVKSGELEAYSIGGFAKRVPV
jgi:hypothetical protein